jgi:hypothetical protein
MRFPGGTASSSVSPASGKIGAIRSPAHWSVRLPSLLPANELIAPIHDRMLAILPNEQFPRWLSDEADPRDLLVPFPADQLAVSLQRSRR